MVINLLGSGFSVEGWVGRANMANEKNDTRLYAYISISVFVLLLNRIEVHNSI